jgi:hypothetical protein
LKVSSGVTRDRLRWTCHPPLDAIDTDWRRLASPLHEIGDYIAPTLHAVLMVMEGRVDVALQFEGAAWDYAAFAAVVQAAVVDSATSTPRLPSPAFGQLSLQTDQPMMRPLPLWHEVALPCCPQNFSAPVRRHSALPDNDLDISRQTVLVNEDPTPATEGEQGPSKRIPVDELRDENQWQEEMGRAKERVQTLHRHKKELQARHRETWAAVKQAVDSADPEGLLGMGGPDDEYDDVVVYLTGMVLRNAEVTSQTLIAWLLDRYGSEANPDAVADLLGAIVALQAEIAANR